jgi:hypothetical protein
MPKRAYLLGVGGLVLGLFAGFSIASKSIPPTPLPSASARTQQTPTDQVIPGDGEYFVGTDRWADVRPGLYRSTQNTQQCHWEREKDATGEHIIASDSGQGITYVQLRAGEFFDTNRCSVWHLVTGPGASR